MGEEFLQSFGLRLARLINPQLPMLVVQEKIMQVIAEVRAGGRSQLSSAEDVHQARRNWELSRGGNWSSSSRTSAGAFPRARNSVAAVKSPASASRGQVGERVSATVAPSELSS